MFILTLSYKWYFFYTNTQINDFSSVERKISEIWIDERKKRKEKLWEIEKEGGETGRKKGRKRQKRDIYKIKKGGKEARKSRKKGELKRRKYFISKKKKKLYYGATMAVVFLHKINIEKSL